VINAERAASHSKISIEIITKKRAGILKNVFSRLKDYRNSSNTLKISSPTIPKEEVEPVNNVDEEVSDKIVCEQLKGNIFPMKSEWKKMELIGNK
jgi:hypothetical protein